MSKYTDDVYAALGLVNPHQVSRRYECPVIQFSTQHAHAANHKDHRVTVTFLRDGEWRVTKPIRLDGHVGLTASRDAHLTAAIEWAEKRGLGVEEWVPSGWPNSWIPKPVKDQLMSELKEWRKKQKAAARNGEEKDG